MRIYRRQQILVRFSFGGLRDVGGCGLITTIAGSSPPPRSATAFAWEAGITYCFVVGALLIDTPPVLIGPPPMLLFLFRPRCFFLKNSLLWDLLIGSGYNERTQRKISIQVTEHWLGSRRKQNADFLDNIAISVIIKGSYAILVCHCGC